MVPFKHSGSSVETLGPLLGGADLGFLGAWSEFSSRGWSPSELAPHGPLLSCSHLPRIYQAFLMSATFNEDVQALKELVLHNPVRSLGDTRNPVRDHSCSDDLILSFVICCGAAGHTSRDLVSPS